MPIPPNLTIFPLCIFLWFGLSKILYLKPKLLIIGITDTVTIKDVENTAVDINANFSYIFNI